MQKIYLILRNNQQNGPFSLEELVELSLKPHDLIWVEGKSAGWRYPTEIDALKPFVQTPVKNAGSVNTPSPSSIPREQQSPRSNPAPKTGHIYISIPTKSDRMTVRPESAAPAVPETEGGLTEEALEKKARDLYQKVQAYAEKKEQAAEGVETKYAKSLDDLKQEYSDWLHKSKRSKKKMVVINKKTLGVTGMVASVFLAGFIFARWVTSDGTKVQPLSTGSLPIQKDPLDKEPGKEAAAGQSSSVVTFKPEVKSDEHVPESPAEQPAAREKTPAGKSNGSKQTSSARQQQGSSETASLIEKYTGQAATTTTPVTETPVEAPKKKIPLAQQVSVNGRYMKDDEKKNITGLEITVMNNSDQVVRSVEVQVSYHKKGGRSFDTETVFINNIHPHTPLTIARPGNRKAHSATFQVTQVSGD